MTQIEVTILTNLFESNSSISSVATATTTSSSSISSTLSSETNENIFSKDATLSQSILETYENISQSEKTLIRKLRLRDLLYYAIVQAFPTCGLYVVGSSLNGFGNEASDMDLCLVLTNGELDQQTAAVQYLLIVEQILSTLPAIKEQTLIRAKVPILRIRLQGPFAEMVVDLNANNSVAVRNTHLLCYYAFFDYRVRPLVLLVKEWAKQKDINDSTRSSFTSYSLVLMVLHYLQVLEEPVLPSLQQLFPKRFHGRNDIRILNLSHPLEEIPPESNFKGTNISSLGTLLIGFFDYYAHEYNYDTNAISIRLGREVQRCDVLHGTNTFWGPICIEEPFTRSNTAHSIYDERVFNTIKQKFQDAYEILSSTFDLNKLITIPPPLTPTVSLTDEQYYSHQTGFFQQH